MISANKRIEDIFKRLDKLNTNGLQLVLDMITNLDTREYFYKIKVLDRHNKILQEEEIHDIPREYIDRYIDKYNIIPRLDFYFIKNGILEYQPTIAERENAEKIQKV